MPIGQYLADNTSSFHPSQTSAAFNPSLPGSSVFESPQYDPPREERRIHRQKDGFRKMQRHPFTVKTRTGQVTGPAKGYKTITYPHPSLKFLCITHINWYHSQHSSKASINPDPHSWP